MGNTFTIGIKNYKKVKKEFRKLQQAPEIVAKRIVSDFKSRAPGWIAEEVVSVYNINKREIKPSKSGDWTIVNKKDTIFKYIFWERLDYLPIPECCFHFIWCQIA